MSEPQSKLGFEFDRYVSAIQQGSNTYTELPIEICTLLADFAVGLFVFDKDLFSTWNTDENAITLNHWNVRVTGGGWNHGSFVMSSRPIRNMQSFGIIGNPRFCSQIGIGLAICNSENKSDIIKKGIRFQEDCVGFYKDAKNYLWNNEKTMGWNYGFSRQLESWDKRDKESSKVFWITYIKDINGVLMWFPDHYYRYKPILFRLPERFKNVALYPKIQIWNNCGCQLIHGEPWPFGWDKTKKQLQVQFIKLEENPKSQASMPQIEDQCTYLV